MHAHDITSASDISSAPIILYEIIKLIILWYVRGVPFPLCASRTMANIQQWAHTRPCELLTRSIIIIAIRLEIIVLIYWTWRIREREGGLCPSFSFAVCKITQFKTKIQRREDCCACCAPDIEYIIHSVLSLHYCNNFTSRHKYK